MARPTVMTPEVIAKLEEAFAWGCTDREACLWADISPAALYLYQDKNPKFVERKDDLKETPVLLARKTVVKAIQKGDRTVAMQYLERKKKDEFSTKTEQDVRVKELPKPILGGMTQENGDGKTTT
jgi:hypothetical protein